MGILSYISKKLIGSFNLVMKAKQTIQVFRVSYKSVWDATFRATHDLTQEIENIFQKKIDFEHRNKFSYVRNQLIGDFGITWDQSGKMAHDILKKADEELTDYERDLRETYGTP